MRVLLAAICVVLVLAPAEANGVTLRQFTWGGTDWQPDWSPVSDEIIFRRSGSSGGLYIRSASGGSVQELPFDGYEPRWSPDGQWIALASQVHGYDFDIYVVHRTGNLESMIPLTTDFADDRYPTWFPDGNSIIFGSDRSGNYELWSVSVDGGDPVQLTNHDRDDWCPSWSPVGDCVVFSSGRALPYFQLFKMAPSGGAAIQLTEAACSAWQPDCDASGRYVTYVQFCDGQYDIRIVSINGGASLAVTEGPGMDEWPSWSPDGDEIVFARDYDLWIASDLQKPVPVKETSWGFLKSLYRKR